MVRLTLTVPADTPRGPLCLDAMGRAKILQREVIREAVPADDLMQAFIYRHLVPAEESLVCVLGPAERFTVGAVSSQPLKIPAGGHACLPATIPNSTPWGAVELVLSDPPPGISITNGQQGIVFRSDAGTNKPGLKGTLIVNVYACRDPETMKGREQSKKPRRLLTALPAIPFEIVAP